MMVVREIAAGESAAADAVARAAFESVRHIYRPRPDAVSTFAAKNRETRRLVAVRDGEIAGTVHYYETEGRLHLMRLAVAPRHQRKSVARHLVEHLMKLAASRNCRALSLYMIQETGNGTIFEKLGFRVVETKPAEDLESLTGAPLAEAFMECAVPPVITQRQPHDVP